MHEIAKILVETGAYSDLETPVILASGEIGLYYVNTQNILQDGGEWEKFGDNANAMIAHAMKVLETNKSYLQVIDTLASTVQERINTSTLDAISGGQRRDWLFSGPVAMKLGLPHVALYKQGKGEDKLESSNPHFVTLEEKRVVHIVDLITKGSSIYSTDTEHETGWIPMLRNKGASIDDLFAVVSRLQGGEESMKKIGLDVFSQVQIDSEFLQQHSRYPHIAVNYQQDPDGFSKMYFSHNGALDFLPCFDPKKGKLDRARKFLLKWGDFLETHAIYKRLQKAVQTQFGYDLTSLRFDYNKTLDELKIATRTK